MAARQIIKVGERAPATSESPKGRFAAIDFETADYKRDSACSIGIVIVEGTQILRQDYFLIRPPRPQILFTHLHGIAWHHVADKPLFVDLWPTMRTLFDGVEFIAAHNATFDRSVLLECCRAAALAPPTAGFQCTVKLARKAWALRPARLPDVCRHLGFHLQHHNAASDALACANIVIAARQQCLAVAL